MKKTVLFDLDGTLLPINDKDFETSYMGSLCAYVKDIIDPKEMAEKIWKASYAMIKSNDASKTNEEVFWEAFEPLVGSEVNGKLKDIMDEYYTTGFDAVKAYTHVNDDIVASVRYLQDKGVNVILATNPLLPRIATDKRIEWAGFTPEDFDYVTRFEINHFLKPNPNYYKEIMEVNNLDPKNCIMIGNDVQEDMMVREMGMEGWLLEDDLIHRGGDINCEWRGTRSQLLDKLKEVF